MSAETPTVSLSLDEFLAIGEQVGRLRGRIGWLEYRVDELLQANNRLVERVRKAEAVAGVIADQAA
jgi:hypothetical protein